MADDKYLETISEMLLENQEKVKAVFKSVLDRSKEKDDVSNVLRFMLSEVTKDLKVEKDHGKRKKIYWIANYLSTTWIKLMDSDKNTYDTLSTLLLKSNELDKASKDQATNKIKKEIRKKLNERKLENKN